MPALVVPSGALLRLVWAAGGTPFAVNVIGLRKTGAIVIDQTVTNQVAGLVRTAHTSSGLASQQSSSVSLSSIGLRDISSPSNPEFIGSGTATVGGDAGGILPPQIAFCVTLRTARAGKSYRGRTYLGGFTVSTNTATGTATSTVRDTCVSFMEVLRTSLTGAGVALAVVSRKNLSTELITVVQGRDLVWDTIRGRATAGI